MLVEQGEFMCQLKSDLERLGFVFRREGGRVVVTPSSKLTPAQREDLRRQKSSLLASIDVVTEPVPWNESEAVELCRLVQHKLHLQGWPEEPAERDAVAVLWARIDAAALGRDLAKLRAEAEGILAALDACYPRKLSRTIRYVPPIGPTFTGWLRARGLGEAWLPVMSDIESDRDCWEALNDYSKLYKSSDTAVLPAGENPNQK